MHEGGNAPTSPIGITLPSFHPAHTQRKPPSRQWVGGVSPIRDCER